MVRVIARSVLARAWRSYARARDKDEDPVLLAHTALIGVAHDAAREINPRRALLLLDLYNWIDDHVGEEMDEEGLTRAVATREVLDRVHRDLVDMADYFNDLSFPLSVYRGMLVATRDVVRLQGASWTPNRAVAEGFATGSHDASEVTHAGLGGNGRSVLLEGTIRSPLDVDWRQTLSLFHGYSLAYLGDTRHAEEEIRLLDGRVVRDVRAIPLEDA